MWRKLRLLANWVYDQFVYPLLDFPPQRDNGKEDDKS